MGLPPDAQQPQDTPMRPMSPQLKVPETLAIFKNGLDAVLHDLDKSRASHRKVSEQAVDHASYGDFDEARALAGAYDGVHAALKALSRALGEQLEALGISADMANRGYHAVDEEHRDRLRVLQAQMQQSYEQRVQAQDVSLSNDGQGPTNDGGKNSRSVSG